MTTEVVNFRDVQKHWNSRAETWDSPKFVYMGRENKAYHLKASPFANPFPVKRNKGETEAAARQRSLADYLDYISRRPDLLAQLPIYRGKVWVCWCKPLPCHCDVLVELLNGIEVETMPGTLATQVGMDGSQQPVLAWDKGGAGHQIAQNRYGVLYRDRAKNGASIGLPGKVYQEWSDWRHDYFKMMYRVRGCAVCSGMSQREYARYRYETGLAAREGRTDEISRIEREVLRELLAELRGDDGS